MCGILSYDMDMHSLNRFINMQEDDVSLNYAACLL